LNAGTEWYALQLIVLWCIFSLCQFTIVFFQGLFSIYCDGSVSFAIAVFVVYECRNFPQRNRLFWRVKKHKSVFIV